MDNHYFLTACHFLNDANTLMIDSQCRWEGINSKYNCSISLSIHIYCILPETHIPIALLFLNATTLQHVLNNFFRNII